MMYRWLSAMLLCSMTVSYYVHYCRQLIQCCIASETDKRNSFSILLLNDKSMHNNCGVVPVTVGGIVTLDLGTHNTICLLCASHRPHTGMQTGRRTLHADQCSSVSFVASAAIVCSSSVHIVSAYLLLQDLYVGGTLIARGSVRCPSVLCSEHPLSIRLCRRA